MLCSIDCWYSFEDEPIKAEGTHIYFHEISNKVLRLLFNLHWIGQMISFQTSKLFWNKDFEDCNIFPVVFPSMSLFHDFIQTNGILNLFGYYARVRSQCCLLIEFGWRCHCQVLQVHVRSFQSSESFKCVTQASFTASPMTKNLSI